MFSKLYDKCLKLASHKSANIYLSIVSFVESSIFPIPPDVMIVPMAIAKKSSYFKIFLNATIFSVLGGLLGYLIGFAFADFAMSLVEFYGYEEKAAKLKMSLSLILFKLVLQKLATGGSRSEKHLILPSVTLTALLMK